MEIMTNMIYDKLQFVQMKSGFNKFLVKYELL